MVWICNICYCNMFTVDSYHYGWSKTYHVRWSMHCACCVHYAIKMVGWVGRVEALGLMLVQDPCRHGLIATTPLDSSARPSYGSQSPLGSSHCRHWNDRQRIGRVCVGLCCTLVMERNVSWQAIGIRNSLDANASSIDIKLVNKGLTLIQASQWKTSHKQRKGGSNWSILPQVKDNGVGISEGDRACMAVRYCTSKISSFQDIERLTTFGFRGILVYMVIRCDVC